MPRRKQAEAVATTPQVSRGRMTRARARAISESDQPEEVFQTPETVTRKRGKKAKKPATPVVAQPTDDFMDEDEPENVPPVQQAAHAEFNPEPVISEDEYMDADEPKDERLSSGTFVITRDDEKEEKAPATPKAIFDDEGQAATSPIAVSPVKSRSRSRGPLTPGERFRKDHEKLAANIETLEERAARLSAKRQQHKKDTAGTVFDRLSTPRQNHVAALNDAKGFDFGSGKKIDTNFGTGNRKLQFEGVDVPNNEKRTPSGKKGVAQVDVKSRTRPQSTRKEDQEAARSAARQQAVDKKRNFTPAKLTMPTTNPNIERLATPKSALRAGDSRRMAKESRGRGPITKHAPGVAFVDTTQLSDVQFTRAIELGILVKKGAAIIFEEPIYTELLGAAGTRKEKTVLTEIRSRIIAK
ncbi:unnamed protein product, partial [Mesorhabditis spiculigera]